MQYEQYNEIQHEQRENRDEDEFVDNDARVIVDWFIIVTMFFMLFMLYFIVLLLFLKASVSAVRVHVVHDVSFAVGMQTSAVCHVSLLRQVHTRTLVRICIRCTCVLAHTRTQQNSHTLLHACLRQQVFSTLRLLPTTSLRLCLVDKAPPGLTEQHKMVYE